MLVGRRGLQVADEGLHRIDGRARVQSAEELVMLFDAISEEPLLVACTTLADVDGRENALIGHLAVEHDLRVAGAFKLLENDLIHPAAGFDKCRRNDGERTTALDIARGAEDPPRNLHGASVESARHRASTAFHIEVERAAETGQRVEQQDHVLPQFNQPPRIFQRKRRHAHVVVFLLIIRCCEDGGARGTLKIGYLFGPLVHEQSDELTLGVILADGGGNLLEQDSLARAWWCHNERPLPLADRRNQVDHPHRNVIRPGDQVELFIRIDNLAGIEVTCLLPRVGVDSHNRVDASYLHRALTTGPKRTLDQDPVAEFELLDEGRWYEVVVITFGKIRPKLANEAEFLVADQLQHSTKTLLSHGRTGRWKL